jgi:hypothetical protein
MLHFLTPFGLRRGTRLRAAKTLCNASQEMLTKLNKKVRPLLLADTEAQHAGHV